MEGNWNPFGEFLNSTSFDNTYLYDFSDATALTEPIELQPAAALEDFNFEVTSSNQAKGLANTLDSIEANELSTIPTSNLFLSTNPQLENKSRPTRTTILHSLPGRSQVNAPVFLDNSHSVVTSTIATVPVQLSNTDSLLKGDEVAVPLPPKVRQTRKRKPVSAEEKERKRRAFLARNREAAKKCRAKRKNQQENVQEKSQRLSYLNIQYKTELLILQAMKTQLMLEFLPFQQLPGVMDEINSIKAGQPQRPPMFFFCDSLSLRHISEIPLDHSLKKISRQDSNSSDFYESSKVSQDGSEGSRSN